MREAMIAAALLVATQAQAAACPDHTLKRGSQCVLEEDLDLTSTMYLAPNTHLNCQGHTIRPSTPGTMSALGNATPPTPRTAIIAVEPHGVTIRNCVIGDDGGTPDDITDDQLFQSGIVLLGNATAEGAPGALRNRIVANETHAIQFGINGVSIRDTDILDNDVFQGGIGVFRDSAHVNVSGNRIRGLVVAQTAFSGIVPTEAAYALTPNQAGIYALTAAGLPLLTAVVGGQRLQFPMRPDVHIDDIRVTGNDIHMPAAATGRDIAGIRAQHVTRGYVANNVIVLDGVTEPNGNTSGIQFLGGIFTSVTIPSTCSGNPGFACVTPADCAPSYGTCGATTTVTNYNLSGGTVIEDNSIDGDLLAGANTTSGIVMSELDARIEGNTIVGRGRGHGIRLNGKNGLETAIVTRNSVSNVIFGLQLRQENAPNHAAAFTAEVSLNDFVDSVTRAVRADFGGTPSVSIDIPVELSVGSRGNHYGRSCADSDGFRDASEPAPRDTVSPGVDDKHPYGTPISGVFDETLLAQTCK